MEPAVGAKLAGVFQPGYFAGRAWRLAVLARLQVEDQDRTVAWSGPHSRRNPRQPQAVNRRCRLVLQNVGADQQVVDELGQYAPEEEDGDEPDADQQ